MGLFGFGKKKEKKKEPVVTADTLLQAGMEEYKKCNYGNAKEYWAAAADRGSAEANYQIARMYCEGKGVEADEIMSLVWYYDATDAGHVKARQELDALQEKYKETAAELRHRGYQSYEAGNFEEAFNLFAPAALMGEPIAQFDVYHMLLLGEGVPENQKEAFKWGLRSARQGDMDAQYGIACCYVQGIGTETSTANALEWFKKAGAQGHSTAQYKTGLYYFYGQSVPGNRPEALKWFQAAAKQGVEDAQKMIDENYAGKIDLNEKHAITFDELLDKMLDDELDDPDELMDELYRCEDLPMNNSNDVDDELDDFWDDINSDMEEMDKEEKRKEALLVKPDSEKTADELYEHATILHKGNQTFTWSASKCERIIELLMLAEKKGHKKARSTAIEYLKKYAGVEKYQCHYKEKAKYELRGAQLGDPRMQYDTAQNYLAGRGVEKNQKEAAEWLKKSAEQGYEDAVYALGMMYLDGTVVKKDEKKAFDMFKKAGEDADSNIVGQLGIMYLKGIGTEKNPEKAVKLLEDAWYSGCGGEVIYELGKVYYEGKLVEQDYEKAFELMEEAEDYGNVEAMYYLGMFNEKGIGTPIDMDEAVNRYEEAADCGHKEAKKRLEELKA